MKTGNMEVRYKWLESTIRALEVLENTGGISDGELERLNEYRLIIRQLEILELMKERLERDTIEIIQCITEKTLKWNNV